MSVSRAFARTDYSRTGQFKPLSCTGRTVQPRLELSQAVAGMPLQMLAFTLPSCQGRCRTWCCLAHAENTECMCNFQGRTLFAGLYGDGPPKQNILHRFSHCTNLSAVLSTFGTTDIDIVTAPCPLEDLPSWRKASSAGASGALTSRQNHRWATAARSRSRLLTGLKA